MLKLREIFAYVHYSESSADFWSVGILPYSLKDETREVSGKNIKSFAFAIVLPKGKSYTTLYDDAINEGLSEADAQNVIAEYEEMKQFFGRMDDQKGEANSLNGKGNTRLRFAPAKGEDEGKQFFGYIYSPFSGGKAIEWFAERSKEMPTLEEAKEEPLPSKYADASKSEQLAYYKRISQHTLQELAELFGVEIKRTASKSQKSPKLVEGERAPSKGNLPSRSTLPSKVPGVPTSRAKAPLALTKENIDAAVDLIFRAMQEGKIVPESEYGYVMREENDMGSGDDDISPPLKWQGFAGSRGSVREHINEQSDLYPEENYDTKTNLELVFKLMSRRREPRA